MMKMNDYNNYNYKLWLSSIIIIDPYLLYHCANLCHEDNENNEEDD